MTVASTAGEVEALRPLWRSLSVSNLDADIDYFLTVVSHHPEAIAPHVVCIERDGLDPLLIVARLESHPFPVKLGYRVLLSPRLRAIVVSFDGLLGVTSEDDLRTCLAALQDSLRAGPADSVIFQKVTLRSPLHEAVRRASRAGSRLHGLATTTRWLVDLPETMDEFMGRRSPGARRKARTDDRRLSRTYNDEVRVVRLDESGLATLRSDLETVSGRTYQRALGVGGSTTAVGKALIPLCLEKGWLRVWMLYLEDKPVAFWWGNLYDGVLTIDSPGFDPGYAKDGVGIHTMYAMFAELCADPLATAVDLGHGDAEYKVRYSTRSLEEQDMVLLAPRVGPLLLGSFISAALAANSLAYRVLRGSRFATSLRRSWRSRLTARTASAAPPEAGGPRPDGAGTPSRPGGAGDRPLPR